MNKKINSKIKAIEEKEKQLELLKQELEELKEYINLDNDERNIINIIFDYNTKAEDLGVPVRLGLIKSDASNLGLLESLKSNIQIFPVNAEGWFPTRDEIVIEAWAPSDNCINL